MGWGGGDLPLDSAVGEWALPHPPPVIGFIPHHAAHGKPMNGPVWGRPSAEPPPRMGTHSLATIVGRHIANENSEVFGIAPHGKNSLNQGFFLAVYLTIVLIFVRNVPANNSSPIPVRSYEPLSLFRGAARESSRGVPPLPGSRGKTGTRTSAWGRGRERGFQGPLSPPAVADRRLLKRSLLFLFPSQQGL